MKTRLVKLRRGNPCVAVFENDTWVPLKLLTDDVLADCSIPPLAALPQLRRVDRPEPDAPPADLEKIARLKREPLQAGNTRKQASPGTDAKPQDFQPSTGFKAIS